jgi:2-furoate---CoA ligase
VLRTYLCNNAVPVANFFSVLVDVRVPSVEENAMHMGRTFQRTVERYPERTAVVDPDADVRYTYKQWNDRVNRVATTLAERGVEQGDRVGVILQPRIQAGTVYWAIQKLGAVFTPYNVRAAADEIQHLVNNTEPNVLIYSSVAKDAVDGARQAFESTDDLIYTDNDLPEYATAFDDFVDRGSVEVEPANLSSEETSVILHTSGTTGRPKGVPRSHTNTHAAATAHAIQSQWVDGEATLGAMPIYHTMGLRSLTTATVLGGTWAAQRSFDPQQAVALIDEEELTSLYLVPTVFHDLARYNGSETADLSSVRRLAYAGTPMTATVQQELREMFDPDIFINHFGSTEVYTYSICSWLDQKPGCAGRAGINTRVRVVTPEQEGTVPPTETVEQEELGEIIVDATSPEAFDGYLNHPEATENAFQDNWYFTGDLGYHDEDGDLFVVGRVDDMIISGGENIYPVEVEDVLDSHKDVNEVAVVGLQDDRWNQIVTAFVKPVPSPGVADFNALADTLDEYCRNSGELANFKRPRKFVFVDEIMRSNVGKVLRRELEIDDLDAELYATVDV